MSNSRFAVIGDKDLVQIFQVVGMDVFESIKDFKPHDYDLILDTVGEKASEPLGSSVTLAPLPIIMGVKI